MPFVYSDNSNTRNDLNVNDDVYGGCLEAAVCTKIFLPVCGTDDRTYSNKCSLDHKSCLERATGRSFIRLKHDGMCK